MLREKNTLTVGPHGAPHGADVTGEDGAAIQRAIDQLAAEGGGTVKVLPGRYPCIDSIRMRSHIRLIGEREATILVHGPVPASALAMDADIGERQITPLSSDGFVPGMGVVLRDRNKPNLLAPMPVIIERIENGILFINERLIHDWIAENDACVVACAPLLHAFEVSDIAIDGFTLEGAVENPPSEMEDLWGGNLYFRRANDVTISNVTSRHAAGDGIRFGQCANVTVTDCEIHDNSHYGIHPGSHSRPVHFSRLHIHHNGSDGLYICWGIQNSVFEHCEIHHNGHRLHRTGICIGHKDVDNVIANNHIYENHKHGIHIREKTAANGAHRNVFRDNLVENNGSPMSEVPQWAKDAVPETTLTGCGIYVNGITNGLIFENNIVRETRQGAAALQRRGLVIAPGVAEMELKNNLIENHPDGDIVDER